MNALRVISAIALASLAIVACKTFADDESSAMVIAPSFEMRPRPTDEAEFDEYVEYLVEVADPRTCLLYTSDAADE